MKKFLSLVLALVMTMSLVTVSAGAKDFTDDSKITYKEAVDVLSEAGVIDGYSDGSFNPSNTLTRGAAAKIICNLILGPTAASALVADAAPYSDVPANHTFAGYIAYCQKTGIISGYADGTFKPANSLTGYAFMKMLLGALGYDSANEGYTGANWSINVAKQAISIGLNDGLEGEFNGVKSVNREEACLYAFNTLNATMVEYDTQTIVIANGTVSTNKVAKDMENNARTETIKEDNKMQFAEKYFTNLEKEPTTDDFGRPANKWTYKNTDIGTYVDYSLMVAEYTDAVSGKEVYDKIGKTAMDKYDLTATIDGNDAAKTILADVNKNNKEDMEGTGTGVLTQVFVDDDNKAAAVVEINTYLGIADSDYSEKKDEVSFDVYGLKYENKTYSLDKSDKDNKSYVTFKVSGEDFNVSKVAEDDAYLFTVAGGDVQSCVPAETVKDTEITSFKKGSNVTAGGTKYSFSKAAYYDITVLANYTDGSVTNLKDTTYNIYLDTYGNLIGLEEVDAVDNYVFITGADAGSSNLSTKTNDANAIFLDGTSKVIEVSNTKGDGVADAPIINKWFTYTVDKNGVYTLNSIKSTGYTTKDKVGQYAQVTNKSIDIDKKNITLDGQGDFTKVYGNADSIYLTATLKKVVNGKDGQEKANGYVVISGVDNVTTGVKNASIKTWTEADAQKDADSKFDGTWAGTSSGVYTLFKDNGYVIAAVVVGEDAASSKNLVYSIKDSVELESYDKTADEWTWTMKAVDAKGQEITLTEVSDSLSELKKIDTKGVWYQVKYDAKGNVISVEEASDALTGYKRIVKFGDIEKAIDAEDTVLLETGTLNDKLTLKGSTLYGNTNGTRGVVVDDETNVVFIQTNNNKETTSYENGVKAVETALKNLNVAGKDKNNNDTYKYEFSAIIEDGIATTVVIRDRQPDDYTSSTPAGNTDLKVTVSNGAIAVTGPEASVTTDDMTSAIVDALSGLGYTNVKVTVSGGNITGVVGTKNSVEYNFGVPTYTKA